MTDMTRWTNLFLFIVLLINASPGAPTDSSLVGLPAVGANVSPDSLLAELQARLDRNPDSAALLFAVGEAAYRAGRYDLAVYSFRRATDVWTDSAEVWHQLGLALHRQGDNSRAEKALRRSLELAPRRPELYNHLGLVLMARNRTIDAISVYFAALGIDPTYVKARYNLGYAYLDRRNYRMAEMQLRRVVRDDPRFMLGRHALATVLRKAGRNDEARAELDAAIEVDSTYVDVYVERGFLSIRQRQYANAVDDFQRALDFQPHNARAHYGLGLTYTFQRKWVQAQFQCDNLVPLDSTLAERLQGVISQ